MLAKKIWKAGNMLYPLPVTLISCGNDKLGYNIITIAWTGTICTNPPMTYISLRPSRYSYDIIKETKEFVINLATEKLVKAVDFCGVRSGNNIDKFKVMNLNKENASIIKAPLIKESPVNIECKVTDIIHLGSHDMFMAKVVAVQVEEKWLDENGKFHFNDTKPICYSHGSYYNLNKPIGTFGYSVRKKLKKKNKYRKK